MQSLLNVKFSWHFFAITLVLIMLTFPTLDWFMYIGIAISLHQFMLLFESIGSIVPIRYLFGSFMCLQFFLGPTFAYCGLDDYQRGFLKMQIPAVEYFSYAIPAVTMFILGLHYNSVLQGEVVDLKGTRQFVKVNKTIPYIFIGIGFVANFGEIFFSNTFTFIFVLLSNFKFVGLFLIILGRKKLDPLIILIVFGSIVISSLRNAMFHDLITWIIFLGAVLAIKYKPSKKIKLIVSSAFITLALFIQLLKGEYRTATWEQGSEGNIETLSKSFQLTEEKSGGFSWENIAKSNVRINQGFIITNIMNTVPSRVPFENGKELLIILESAFLPRILAPNKLNAGDRFIFMKYSGIPLAPGTSMGLSSVGDAYINFGIFGGSIFMLFYGLFINFILKKLNEYSYFFPVLLLFTPLIFYYPIRPDCELQTILGHIVKSCFLLFVIFQIWKVKFRRILSISYPNNS